MKPRNALPQKERHARSKAAKLIHDSPLVIGSLVEMANTWKAQLQMRKGR